MKGVILHGGRGTRLRPLTHTGPKQLIPIANKPISQYVLEDLKDAGVKDIIITLGDILPERVVEYYGDGSKFGVKISYIEQGAPRGIAQAVGLCRQFAGKEPIVVYLGDNILKGGIKEFVKEFEKSKFDAMVLLSKIKEPQRFGVAEFDKERRLVRLVEKPKKPPSEFALVGIYLFTPVIFESIETLKPSWRGELEITEAIQNLIDKGYRVEARFVSGWWKDTGTPEDMLEANRLKLEEMEPRIKGTVEKGAKIEGKVSIGRNTKVDKGCVIRGPAIIGENCTIESNAYIGPYTSIQDNVSLIGGEIENSIIMSGCHIESNKRIVDSLIGNDVKIYSAENNIPRGYKFVLGERSYLTL